jgi:hypothetical protein
MNALNTTGTGKLQASDLHSLEQYSKLRPELRRQVIEHKKLRTIAIGSNATFCFEDRITVQYQIQEMLRVERIFEAAGIDDELQAYNPLIPDGRNWKVTFLLEFPDAEQRKVQLGKLKGVEDRCWVQVGDQPRVWAIADEDMERENADKTAAVHFLRFELTDSMALNAKSGGAINVGIDHDNYRFSTLLASASRDSLTKDLT